MKCIVKENGLETNLCWKELSRKIVWKGMRRKRQVITISFFRVYIHFMLNIREHLLYFLSLYSLLWISKRGLCDCQNHIRVGLICDLISQIRKEDMKMEPLFGLSLMDSNVCNYLFLCYVIQMFFAASILHVHLMQWDDMNLVEAAVTQCDQVWETIQSQNVSTHFIIVFTILDLCIWERFGLFCPLYFFQ